MVITSKVRTVLSSGIFNLVHGGFSCAVLLVINLAFFTFQSWLASSSCSCLSGGGTIGYRYYQAKSTPALDLSNVQRQLDQLLEKSQSDTFTAADLVTLKNLVSTVNDLDPALSSISAATQAQINSITASIATIEGKEGPAGPEGEAGSTGPQGPSGIASCPYGSCLSLQTTGSTVQESGSLSVSGDVLAGGTIQGTLLVGDGSGVTSVDALSVGSLTSADLRNATLFTSGTLDVARLPTAIPATSLASGTVSNTEFGHLDGVTSGIQAQLDTKTGGSGTTDKLAKWTSGTGLGNSLLTETVNGISNSKAFGVAGYQPISGTWSTAGYTRGLELPLDAALRFAKSSNTYSYAFSQPNGLHRVNILASTADDNSQAASTLGYIEAGNWTTAGWGKFLGLSDSRTIRWDSSPNYWGMTATSSTLYFMTSTASDASAAATYQGNWSTTGLAIGTGSVTAARALEVRSTSAAIRASYDSSKYWELGMNSSGNHFEQTNGQQFSYSLDVATSPRTLLVSKRTASGEMPEGLQITTSSAVGTQRGLSIGANLDNNANTFALVYWSQGLGATKSALEIATATGATTYGDLKLMRSGGTVAIGCGTSAAARALEVCSTSAQQRWSNGTEYWQMEVTSIGDLNITGLRHSGDTNSIAIGAGASATSGTHSIAIGQLASSTAGSLALGYNASSSASGGMAIGNGAVSSTSAAAHALGHAATATGNASIALGGSATASGSFSIAIGQNAVADQANTLVSGSSTYSILNVFFGSGRVAASPVAWTLNGTGGSGTNITGGDITIASGRPTGSGNPGKLYFSQTSGGEGSGSTLRNLVQQAVLDENHRFGIGVTSGLTGRLQVSESTAGNEVLRIESQATNDDPNYVLRQYRAATTDATQTTLGTITLTASKTYLVEARVVARRTGGASGTAEDSASYVVRGLYKTVAGAATLVGSLSSDFSVEDQAGWDATLDTSGTDVRVRVTGAASNNVTWHATVMLQDAGT